MKKNKKIGKNNGFSLVELSIALVIIGLLVGGILTGQSLIRAAELRSVTTELSTYKTAVHTFRDKYFALPGDMDNATDFWGAMSNCGSATAAGTGTQTCNGNGDGILDAPGTSAAATQNEMFSFWKHLANAGLVEGDFTQVSGTARNAASLVGINVPPSKLGQAGWAAFNINDYHPAVYPTYFFTRSYGNSFMHSSNSDPVPNGRTLTTEEAWNIDTKIDDGKPETGNVSSFKNYAGTTTTNCSNSSTKEYALSNTGGFYCALIFSNAF